MASKCFAKKGGDCTILKAESSREMRNKGACGKPTCPFYKPEIDCIRKDSGKFTRFIRGVQSNE